MIVLTCLCLINAITSLLQSFVILKYKGDAAFSYQKLLFEICLIIIDLMILAIYNNPNSLTLISDSCMQAGVMGSDEQWFMINRIYTFESA